MSGWTGLLALAALFMLANSQGCVSPNGIWGAGTLSFCVPPFYNTDTMNNTKSAFTLKDRDTELAYVLQHTPHVQQAQSRKMNVTLCQKHFKEFLCVQAFPQCVGGSTILPCAGFCIFFWRGCGYNESVVEANCGTAFAPATGYTQGLCAAATQFAGIGNGIIWSSFLAFVLLCILLLFCASFWGNLPFLKYVCCLCCRGKKSAKELGQYEAVPQDDKVSKKTVAAMMEAEEVEQAKTQSYWVRLLCSQAFTYVAVILLFCLFLFVLSIPTWVIEGRNEVNAFPNATVPDGTNLKWTYSSSVYFSFVTMTTIGYGDL
jgi:hypothetical protein